MGAQEKAVGEAGEGGGRQRQRGSGGAADATQTVCIEDVDNPLTAHAMRALWRQWRVRFVTGKKGASPVAVRTVKLGVASF